MECLLLALKLVNELVKIWQGTRIVPEGCSKKFLKQTVVDAKQNRGQRAIVHTQFTSNALINNQANKPYYNTDSGHKSRLALSN
jgi:hypothetical protein